MQNFCQEKSTGTMEKTCPSSCTSDIKEESKTSRPLSDVSTPAYTQEELQQEASHYYEKIRKLFALPASQRTKEALEDAMHHDFDRVREELSQREPRATWGPQKWTQDVESSVGMNKDQAKLICQMFGLRFEGEEPEDGNDCEDIVGEYSDSDSDSEEEEGPFGLARQSDDDDSFDSEDMLRHFDTYLEAKKKENEERAQKCSEAMEQHRIWNLPSCFVHPTPRGIPMTCQCDTLRPQNTHLYHVENKPIFSEYIEKNKIAINILTDLELDTYQKELQTQRGYCNDGIIASRRMAKVGFFALIMADHIRQLDKVEELLGMVNRLIWFRKEMKSKC